MAEGWIWRFNSKKQKKQKRGGKKCKKRKCFLVDKFCREAPAAAAAAFI